MPRPKRPQQYYDQIKDKFREERNLRLGTARQAQISTPGVQRRLGKVCG